MKIIQRIKDHFKCKHGDKLYPYNDMGIDQEHWYAQEWHCSCGKSWSTYEQAVDAAIEAGYTKETKDQLMNKKYVV